MICANIETDIDVNMDQNFYLYSTKLFDYDFTKQTYFLTY